MKKVFIIIGARPNFMKAFPVYEALKEDFALTLIHTGQHFDAKMSDVFFNQLKFPRPDIHLTLEKRTKAGDFDDKLYVNNADYLKNIDNVIQELMSYDGDLGQLGEIRDKLNVEFEKGKPDLVIVFGDVTSTLAAGLAAKTLNIDLAHIESGLRSGDLKMPEEVNRVLTDHITKYYFVTEQSGIDNLKEIGITENVYLVGNTMIDTQKKYLQQALDSKYHETLGVKLKECKGSMDLWDGKSSERILLILLLEYYNENIKYYFTNHPPFKPLYGNDYLSHLNKTMNLDCISYNFFKTWINLFHINSFYIFQFLNNLLHKFNNIFSYNLKPYYWKFKNINTSFFSDDKIFSKSKEYFNFVRIDMHNVEQIANNIIITSADKIYFEKYFFKYYQNLLNKKEIIFICCDVNDYNIIKNKLIIFNNVGYIVFNNLNMPKREYYQSIRIFGLYFLRKNINFEKSFIFNIDTLFKCKSIFSDVINCTKNSDTKLILAGHGNDNDVGSYKTPLYQKCSMNKVLIYNTDFIDLFYKIYVYEYCNLTDKRFLDQISLFIATNYSKITREYVNTDKLIIGCAKYKD